jgi:hypothetical protein
MFETIFTPAMTSVEIRDFVGVLLEQGKSEEDMTMISEALQAVSNEVSSMYTQEVLQCSASWHAFNQSTMKDDSEVLPDTTEQGIAKIITNLVERKLKVLLS